MSRNVEVGPVASHEHDEVVALVVAAQRSPARHVCYLSTDPGPVAAELAELAPDGWRGHLVARRTGRVVGFVGVEHDREPPRAWWHGPYVATDEPFEQVGAALLAAARRRLPAHVVEEELGPDEAHTDLATLALRAGFHADPASAVLSRAARPAPAAPAPPGVAVRTFAEADRTAVATLVDEAFPASHVPGHRVDEGHDRIVLVAHDGGEVVGFVAAERQEDGSGYLDLVGVAAAHRGRGIGATLVSAALAELADHLGCARVHLTVRETNHAARRLYQRLGFDEERLIRPYRRGFSVP